MREPVTVFILCGGQSRRMGTDKASLIFQGKSFIQGLASRLSAAGQVVFSANDRARQTEGYPVVCDELQGCGPLGGIVSGLRVCKTPLAFFCACDMPLLDTAMVDALQAALRPESDGIIPIDSTGRIHPLCALFRVTVLDAAQQHLQCGDYRLQNLLQQIHIQQLQVSAALEMQLKNINVPEEYEALCCEGNPL